MLEVLAVSLGAALGPLPRELMRWGEVDGLAAGSMIQFAGNLSQVSANFCLIQFGERQEMTAANALDRVFSRDG
jgi:hypothetical protein